MSNREGSGDRDGIKADANPMDLIGSEIELPSGGLGTITGVAFEDKDGVLYVKKNEEE